MSLKGKIASVALTDTGKVREHNEDMIGTEADIGLFVLADGMGGYNAGEGRERHRRQNHHQSGPGRLPARRISACLTPRPD